MYRPAPRGLDAVPIKPLILRNNSPANPASPDCTGSSRCRDFRVRNAHWTVATFACRTNTDRTLSGPLSIIPAFDNTYQPFNGPRRRCLSVAGCKISRHCNSSVYQMDLPIHARGQIDVVGDCDNGFAALMHNRVENVENLLRVLRVETAGWFVREHQRRIVGKPARNGDTLALSAGQLIRPLVEMVGEAERTE